MKWLLLLACFSTLETVACFKIVEQVLSAKRFLESVGDPVPVTGVVFMGMGEPFDNYERYLLPLRPEA